MDCLLYNTRMSGNVCVKSKTVISDYLLETRTVSPRGHSRMSTSSSNLSNIKCTQKVKLKIPPSSIPSINSSNRSSNNSLRHTRSKMYKTNNKNGVTVKVTVHEVSMNSVPGLTPLCKQQLLHTDWRKIPHSSHFGWTQKHDLLCSKLEKEAEQGKISFIYYRTIEEYEQEATFHEKRFKQKFLNGPTATTVIEILEVFEKLRIGKQLANQKLKILEKIQDDIVI